MAWRHSIFPREGDTTIAGLTAPQDDVNTWYRALQPLNSGDPSLLTDLVKLADGQLPSRHETYVGNSRIKIRPGPDLPRKIRLAHALSQFRGQTDDSTEVTRADVDDWIDAEKIEAYQGLEIELRNDIKAVSGQFEFALRRTAFENRIEQFTPMEFMECVLDVMPVLVQTGQLEAALNNGSPLFTGDRLTQVFGLFELADPQGNQATEVLDVIFAADGSVRWGTKEIKTRSDADELKADVTAPKKLLATYKLYRDHVLQVLILRHLHAGTPLTQFRDEVGDLVKLSTLPFYPRGALDETLSLGDFKAQAEAFDQQNSSRWRTFDQVLATELDRAATSTSSVLGVIDLYLAVEKIVDDDEFTATSLKDVVAAGLGVMDDGLGRLGAASPALLGEMGEGLKTLTTSLSKKVVQRALFVFAIVDVVVQTRAVSASTSKAEVVGNAMILAGSTTAAGATGVALLAEAGLITVAAGPVAIAGLVGVALGLLGWAVIAFFSETYPEQILKGCFFRKDPTDRQDALDADNEADDLRAGFVETQNGKVIEKLSVQIAYAVGLTRGFAPSAKDVTSLVPFSDREVEYSIARTPNSSSPPTATTDVDFASWIQVQNMDLDEFGPWRGTPEQKIEEKLFEEFVIPFKMVELDDKKPPLEFEIRTRFKKETLTFEPMSRQVQRWLAENVVAAGGDPPAWQPGPPERLEIRERAKAD